MADTFAYCLREGILGVGWRTESNVSTTDWETYHAEASAIHSDLNVCKYIKKSVKTSSLVWTRDTQGNYYLARVLSGWEYYATEEARARNIDIGNVFRVAFERVSLDEVPGKVVASFRPARSIQEISDPTAREYSKFLWNCRSGRSVYTIDERVLESPDIFSLLDSEEVEDLVFLFLQSSGWFVVPNSRKADTMAFEYLVINPRTNDQAQVQVKTGRSSLDRTAFRDLPFPVILFQSHDRYTGPENSNVTCIARAEMEAFIASAAQWLPARYRNKMELIRALEMKTGRDALAMAQGAVPD